jgi:hypothetical protein
MASTRSNAQNRRSAQQASTEAPKQALSALARHSARIQIAAFTATAKTVAGWAHAADRLAQAVGDELLRRVDGETDSTELIARIMAATDSHLCELSALPRAAANHFDTRLARVPTDNREVR